MSESTQDRLIEAAHQIYLKEGAIPIGFGEVAELAGVSRTLVYSHFSSPEDLVNAVLDRQVRILESAGFADIDAAQSLKPAITLALDIYFEHLRAQGALIHSVSQDSFMAGKLSKTYTTFRNRALTKFTRIAMRDLKLSARLSLPFTILVASLAEEAASMVRADKISEGVARDVMIRSAMQMIDGLRLPA